MSGASNMSGSGGNMDGSASAGAPQPVSPPPAQPASQPGAQPASQPAPPPLLTLNEETDMPGLYTAADQASIQARKMFFRWLAVELVGLGVAAFVAIFGVYHLPEIVFGPINIPGVPAPAASLIAGIRGLTFIGIASAVFGAVALGARLYRNWRRFDTRWYETRAAAESVKSLAWRYATGGRPFPLGGDEAEMRKLFFRRLDDTLTDVAQDLQNTVFPDERKITPAMQRLRNASLAVRQHAYYKSRIEDQETWYLRKATTVQGKARAWHRWLVWIESLGVLGALALALKLIPFNVQGVVGAFGGAIISWTQAQRYQDLEASYRITGAELGSIKQGIEDQKDEPAWATYVDESEEACSREHRLWRATRDKNAKEG